MPVSEHDSDVYQTIQYESVYFKYCFEGCASIDDILCVLDGIKQQFEQWKRENHELTTVLLIRLYKIINLMKQYLQYDHLF